MSAGETSVLASLVAALPEVYQPIYGHEELSLSVSRNSQDRLHDIRAAYVAVEQCIGRPLRVLDLGCAQGYFSLKLAAMGATVLGVDYQGANVAVCRALAAENPGMKVRFEEASVESVLENVSPGEYDLVLGLSVFHHIVHAHGQDTVAGWLTALAGNVEAAVFELALASEPPYWAASQAEDERSLLAGFSFVHELARNPTHLSGISRPLFFASNQIWYAGGAANRFSSWKDQSHSLAGSVHRGTRRYFLGDGFIARIFRLERFLGKANRGEIEQEAAFLANPPPAFAPVAKLLAWGVDEHEAWLVREALPGELLIDLVQGGHPFDARRVIRDVLVQLSALEAAGLFHNDVRVWNVIVGPDGGAALIDYGAISTTREDCVWPRDLVLSFWIFVRDTTVQAPKRTHPERQPFISPYNLPDPYRRWALAVWARPVSEWRFKLLLDLFDDPRDALHEGSDASAIGLWMQAMEQHLDSIGEHANQMEERANSQALRSDQIGSEIANRRDESAALTAAIGVQAESFRAVLDFAQGQAELQRLNEALASREQELGAQVAQAQTESLRLAQTLAAREQALGAQVAHWQAQVLQLTNALAAREKDVAAQQAHSQAELAEVRARLGFRDEELAASQARAQGLESHLHTAKAKVEESSQSSHHWWSVADGLVHDLQTIRSSYSWRMTAPLRAAGSLAGKTKFLARAALVKLISLPRRAARRILLLLVNFVQARQGLKAWVARVVARFPRLDAHLKAFVSTRWRNGNAAPSALAQPAPMLSPELPDESAAEAVQWTAYPPSVRKAYIQLMQARTHAHASTVPDQTTDPAG